MVGTVINGVAILLGALIGLLFGKHISERFRTIVMQGLALCVVLIGLLGAITTDSLMTLILCVVIGSILGEALQIETRLQGLGERVQRLFARGGQSGTFSQGFVTASLVYCVGAMSIVGAMNSGLRGDHTTLVAKSLLDGMSAVIFASTLGLGVAFSALPVLVYQGLIALLAGWIEPVLTQEIITEMSAVGGLLILAIGLNMLEVVKIKVGNMLPAIFLPPLLLPLTRLLGM